MAPRVLVFDDSPLLLDVTVQALNASGMEARGALDLAGLDRALAEGAFQLMLVDVDMPEMFGDDVVEFLRATRRVESRLVLYSALPEEELARRAAAVGADGYVAKARGLEYALAEARRHLGLEEEPKPPAPEVPKKRILVVDDSDLVRLVLRGELVSRGFDVWVAESAEKAMLLMLKRESRPDLVLLDVQMPNVNGEQLCRFIKGNSLFKGIKVLLCSGENIEELRRICREAGADGYLPKNAVLDRILDVDLSGP